MRGDGWNVLILSFCYICCRYFAVFCYQLLCSLGLTGPREYNLLRLRRPWMGPSHPQFPSCSPQRLHTSSRPESSWSQHRGDVFSSPSLLTLRSGSPTSCRLIFLYMAYYSEEAYPKLQMARSVLLACSTLGHANDSGETGGDAGDRVYRECHAAHQTGGSSARGMGLVDIFLCTRVCAFTMLFFGALTLLRQPLPHGFIRRSTTRIRPQPDAPSHRALAHSTHHVLRHRATATGRSRRRGSTARRNRLARPHRADIAYIAQWSSDDLHATRDFALA